MKKTVAFNSTLSGSRIWFSDQRSKRRLDATHAFPSSFRSELKNKERHYLRYNRLSLLHLSTLFSMTNAPSTDYRYATTTNPCIVAPQYSFPTYAHCFLAIKFPRYIELTHASSKMNDE
ncbi:hypothetical protein VTI28DRAFT_7486 [Corynascus sepedonium]